jgi:uncharacterized protein (DUF736 family)
MAVSEGDKMDYDNTNRGTLFKAKEKKSEKSPDYTGTINIAGTEMRLSAWLKESKAGTKYFSLAVSEKDGQYESKSNARPRSEGRTDGNASHVDDDIPF